MERQSLRAVRGETRLAPLAPALLALLALLALALAPLAGGRVTSGRLVGLGEVGSVVLGNSSGSPV